MLRKILFFSAALAVTLFHTGCVAPEYHLRINWDEKSPIVIAALLPLSGNNKIYAEQMREGLMCAETFINNHNGINGREVQLECIDTSGTEDGTAAALDRAVKLNAAGIIAGYSSEEVSMIVKKSPQLRLPTVIPLATSEEHIQISPFIYRNSYSDSQQTAVLSAYLLYWRVLARGAVFIDPVDSPEYSRSVARNFSQAVTDAGGTILKTTILPENGDIPQSIIRDTLATAPQFILIPSAGKRAAKLLKILRENGFNGIICGPDSWDDEDFINALVGVEVGDCVYTAFFTPENKSAAYASFKKEFRQRFYHNPGACETQSFDALIFLGVGLSKADNLFDFDKNWRTIRNHQGAAATYTMLKKGDIDRTVYLNTIGIHRGSGKLLPYARLSRQMQYSKVEDYRIIEE